MVTDSSITEKKIWSILENITDPEIPVITITDLGIVRDVKCTDGHVEVVITPTYSGCPAMDMITMQIRMALLEAGYKDFSVTTTLTPVWTTDWMTEDGRRKLQEYGIAPPNPRQSVCATDWFAAAEAVACPRCHSFHTHRISEFGSTACKALYQCDDCQEPFDYFKCH